MARLPNVGSDDGTWGGILNDFLEVSHASDGTIANNTVGTNQLQNNAVTNAQLDSTTQATLSSVASKYTKPAGGIPESDLASSVQTTLDKAALTSGFLQAKLVSVQLPIGIYSGIPASPIDGVTPADGDIVLLTAESSSVNNGLWVVHSGAWARPTFYASGSDMAGAVVFVQGGNSHTGTIWVLLGTSPKVVDTNGTTWNEFRNFDDRGYVNAWSLYNEGEFVTLPNGQRVVITKGVQANGSSFISAANYATVNYSPVVDVRTFGAKIDGTTDDTAAIQAAINQVSTETGATFGGGGGTVFIPAGWTVITSTLELPSNVHLVGAGFSSTWMQLKPGSNCHMIATKVSPDGKVGNAFYCSVENMTLDGRGSQQTGTGPYHGIYHTTNPYNTAASGDSQFDPSHRFTNVRLYMIQGDGINMYGRSDCVISNVKASFCGGNAFTSSFDTHFYGCVAESPGKHGIEIPHSSVQVTNCKFYNGGYSTGLGSGYGIYAHDCSEVTVTNCDVQQWNGTGLKISDVSGSIFQGITVSQAGYNNSTSTVASGQTFASVEISNGTNTTLVDAACQNDNNGLRVLDTSTKNDIRITHGSTVTGSADVSSDTIALVGSGNRVLVNGVSLTDTLAGLNDVSTAGIANGNVLAWSSSQKKFIASSTGGSFYVGLFGEGQNGAITLDGTTNYHTAASGWINGPTSNVYSLSQSIYVQSLTINSGVTLNTNGFRIFCQGTITNNGTISASGASASGATGGNNQNNYAPGGSNTYGGNGTTTAGTSANSYGIVLGANGGGGGNGVDSTTHKGGATAYVNSGGDNGLVYAPQAVLSGSVISQSSVRQIGTGGGGGGGGGDGTNAGGGGGAGGHNLLIIANSVVNNGSVTANGGNGAAGAAGGNCGGGGGGGAGTIFVYTLTAVTGSGTWQAVPGTGGAGSGTGAAGGNGSTNPLNSSAIFVVLQ